MTRIAKQDVEPGQGATRFSELFASMVNHEMRNALNVVATAASLLETRADSEKIATPVQRITVSAWRMERMLSQLVDFTRIELDGALVLIREPFELGELTQMLIDELPDALKARLVLKCASDTEGRWDRDRIAQLLRTLVSNALQHGAPNENVRVTIRCEAARGTAQDVVVDVENEGEMAPEVLAGLFTPKRRAAQHNPPSGLGLGLYVAQHVALAHGGQLEARSAQGRTRFTLHMPAQPTPITKSTKPPPKVP